MSDIIDAAMDFQQYGNTLDKLYAYLDKAKESREALNIKYKVLKSNNADKEELKLVYADISCSDSLIKSIENDIQFLKESSFIYNFYRAAKHVLSENSFLHICNIANGKIISSSVKIDDKLIAIIDIGEEIKRGDTLTVSYINRTKHKVNFYEIEGYFDIISFKSNKTLA